MARARSLGRNGRARCLRFLTAVLVAAPVFSLAPSWAQGSRPQVPRRSGRKAVPIRYELDESGSRATAGAERSARWASENLSDEVSERAAFDQSRILEFICLRPADVVTRLISTLWAVLTIWYAWEQMGDAEKKREASGGAKYDATTLRRQGSSPRGEMLRKSLTEMGVFFVKVGQTAAQRPDIVGDEVAEELKGLQERSTPFSDATALRIIAEDLSHKGPLAPGVLWEGCDPNAAPLLKDLEPKHVASASLGQVYRGHMHDGRQVALKVQRPGVREVLSLDWAVAVIVANLYKRLSGSANDFSVVVDTVARGVRMELDYHNEAANAEEFAECHAFLPFVSSPAMVPELTGPVGTARVLGMSWYPSRAPGELTMPERRHLVEMAIEACVVQLLITGFVHADPHEGNIRLGSDGRMVFLDFGLMDRVDFGIMENVAAGVCHVLNKDWLALSKVFQEVRFAPTPMMRNDNYGRNALPNYVPCSTEEFAEAAGAQIELEAGGQSRFGAMTTALKTLSDRYLLLTPPFVALLCRTFITLEGLLCEDPELAAEYNVYHTSLPFAICRLLSPRTRKGRKALTEAFLQEPRSSSRRPRLPNWSAIEELLSASAPTTIQGASRDFGAVAGVWRRLVFTAEGAAVRSLLRDLDLFEAIRLFLVASKTRGLRRMALEALVARWTQGTGARAASEGLQPVWGPRCTAAARGWGDWNEEEPYRLPSAVVRRCKHAWRIALKKQVRYCLLPPWRPAVRLAQLLLQVLPAAAWLAIAAAWKARSINRQKRPLGEYSRLLASVQPEDGCSVK